MILTKILLGLVATAFAAGFVLPAAPASAQATSNAQETQTKALGQIGSNIKNQAPKKDRKHKKDKHGKKDFRKKKDHLKLSEAQRAELKTAIENGNYAAWKKILGDAPITRKITAENFTRFAEALKLFMSGDREAAKAIFKELGVKPPFPHKERK